MSGWRDSDGQTAADRRKAQHTQERARFAEELRHRPLGILRGWLGAVFIAVMIGALLLTLR
jgi:hypothetical protein